LYRISQWN